MKKTKGRLPWYWIFLAGVILATNNLTEFIKNVKEGDIVIIISLIIIISFSLYNFEFIRELR